MDLLTAIKKAGVQAMGAENPVNVIFGEIMKANPLEVLIDQRFTLDADFLIIPETLTRYEVDLKHAHSSGSGSTGESLTQKVVIRPGLQDGDKVILLRVQRGQKYVILDKVVEG